MLKGLPVGAHNVGHDVTRTPRRRARRPFAKLVRRFWLIAVLLVAAAGFGGWRIAGLPVFRLSSLTVTPLAHVTRQEIVAQAAIDPHGNVWFLNRGAIERRIERIPYVGSARVAVTPPGAVTIDVTERTIEACVRDVAHASVTIDATRHVLAAGCAGSTPLTYQLAAPIEAKPGTTIRDPELVALMDDRRRLAGAGDAYRSFGHDRLGELQATLRSGVVVKFGDDDDLDRKERLVAPILAQVSTEGREIEAVDVRAADTPVIEFRPPAKPHPHPLDKL